MMRTIDDDKSGHVVHAARSEVRALMAYAYHAGAEESPGGRMRLERLRMLLVSELDISDERDPRVRALLDAAEELLTRAGV